MNVVVKGAFVEGDLLEIDFSDFILTNEKAACRKLPKGSLYPHWNAFNESKIFLFHINVL
jgi:hypothetical protein